MNLKVLSLKHILEYEKAIEFYQKSLTIKEKCELLDKKFIEEFVYANTESVPQNIIETISLISDNFKTSKR